jgi:hypothetical protein
MSDTTAGPKQVPANAQRSGEYWVLVPREAGEVAVVNDAEHVRRDVAAFVARLESAGLLTR